MNSSQEDFIAQIQKRLRLGEYWEVARDERSIGRLRAIGCGIKNANTITSVIRAASLYCEVQDQCGRYAEVVGFLREQEIRSDGMFRRLATIVSNIRSLATDVEHSERASANDRARACIRLLLQIQISQLRSGNFITAKDSLVRLREEIQRLRKSLLLVRNQPISISYGLEAVVQYWIGRAQLSTGLPNDGEDEFGRAVQMSYESLRSHAGVSTGAAEVVPFQERLANANRNMASSLAFGFAAILELRGRIGDAMTMLWAAATVFAGQSDRFRHGFTLLMLGRLSALAAGGGPRAILPDASQIAVDLSKSLDLLAGAYELFWSKDRGHDLHAARAQYQMAHTHLLLASVSSGSERQNAIEKAVACELRAFGHL